MDISVTLVIIIITVITSINGFSNERTINQLIFYPPAVARGQWYRFFSCGFIHADWGHLIFNMLVLFLFGMGENKTGVEYEFIGIFGEKGRWIYLAMYVASLAACLLPTYSKNKDNYHYRSLGASGGVSAVIFASILLDPLTPLGLFFIPIYVAGFIFGFIYLAISTWLDKRGQDNINHSAHIFGAVFGIAFTIIACRIWSDFPVLQQFIDQIKNMDPSQIIRFGV